MEKSAFNIEHSSSAVPKAKVVYALKFVHKSSAIRYLGSRHFCPDPCTILGAKYSAKYVLKQTLKSDHYVTHQWWNLNCSEDFFQRSPTSFVFAFEILLCSFWCYVPFFPTLVSHFNHFVTPLRHQLITCNNGVPLGSLQEPLTFIIESLSKSHECHFIYTVVYSLATNTSYSGIYTWMNMDRINVIN